MFEQLGGRKLVISVVAILLGLGVSLHMGDLPDNLLQLLEVVVGAFMGSNVVAGIVGARFGAPAAPSAAEPAPEATPPGPEAPQALEAPPSLEATSTVSAADAIGAFQQLGALIQQQGEQQRKLLEELSKSSQVSQQALSVVINKLAS